MIECSCKVVSNFKQHDPSTWNPQIEQCPRCASVPRLITAIQRIVEAIDDDCEAIYSMGDTAALAQCRELLRELEVIE